jgi:hypothetical protein
MNSAAVRTIWPAHILRNESNRGLGGQLPPPIQLRPLQLALAAEAKSEGQESAIKQFPFIPINAETPRLITAALLAFLSK